MYPAPSPIAPPLNASSGWADDDKARQAQAVEGQAVEDEADREKLQSKGDDSSVPETPSETQVAVVQSQPDRDSPKSREGAYVEWLGVT